MERLTVVLERGTRGDLVGFRPQTPFVLFRQNMSEYREGNTLIVEVERKERVCLGRVIGPALVGRMRVLSDSLGRESGWLELPGLAGAVVRDSLGRGDKYWKSDSIHALCGAGAVVQEAGFGMPEDATTRGLFYASDLHQNLRAELLRAEDQRALWGWEYESPLGMTYPDQSDSIREAAKSLYALCGGMARREARIEMAQEFGGVLASLVLKPAGFFATDPKEWWWREEEAK